MDGKYNNVLSMFLVITLLTLIPFSSGILLAYFLIDYNIHILYSIIAIILYKYFKSDKYSFRQYAYIFFILGLIIYIFDEKYLHSKN